MGAKQGTLSAVSVSRLPAGYHYDGGGLVLQVTASGARTWLFRFSRQGKRREMGLGPTHTVTLAQARDAARQARLQLLEGIDPLEARNEAKRQQALAQANRPSFAQCCEKYIEAHRAGWKNLKHAAQWANTLSTYCSAFGDRPVAEVTRTEVLACLEAIWSEKQETATRLRGRIEKVLDWATVRGFREGENPARWKGNLDHLLPTISKARRTQHHRALPWKDISAFMVRLRKEQGLSARALEFLILTACRSGEIRCATWGEFDLEAGLWTIPAERMKMGKEHRVPLSTSARQLLRALPTLTSLAHPNTTAESLVFPSNRPDKPLSDMALTAVLRRMEVDAVPHGFRSTFRDWAGESTSYPREVCEHALAHRLADGVEAAYQRGDMLKKRAKMMEDWADFCAKNSEESPEDIFAGGNINQLNFRYQQAASNAKRR